MLSFLPSCSDYFVRPLYAYPPLYTMYFMNFTATTATNTYNTLWYNILSSGRRGGRRVILVAVKAIFWQKSRIFWIISLLILLFSLHFLCYNHVNSAKHRSKPFKNHMLSPPKDRIFPILNHKNAPTHHCGGAKSSITLWRLINWHRTQEACRS